MPFAMSEHTDLDHSTLLFVCLVAMNLLLLAHPAACSSVLPHPDVQTPARAPILPQKRAHSITFGRGGSSYAYRRLISEAPAPCLEPSPSDELVPPPPPPPTDQESSYYHSPPPPPSPSPPPPTDQESSYYQSPPSPSDQQNDQGPPARNYPVLVGVPVGVGAFLCFSGIFGWFLFRRKRRLKNSTGDESPKSDAPISTNAVGPGGGNRSDDSDDDPASVDLATKLPKRYTYRSLAKATSNFDERHKLGEGGFGPVFKGILDDGDVKTEVAVKRVSKRTRGATRQYKAEVKILTRLCHRNLVELVGWCEEDDKFLLVYKFMPNGSLNSQLYNKSRLLTWSERYSIVPGLASALNYLHEECDECVLHRDIKPDNVLLDSSFCAKLSDFGLARLVDHDLGSKSTTLAGTMGYMAPEHIQESRASKESDVYSFGVVLLEIACGRPPFTRKDDQSGNVMNLIDLVWDHYGQNEILKAADRKLNEEYSAEQMERVMVVGLWCAHPVCTERPTIGHAMRVLKFDAPLPELPGSRPLFLSLFAGISGIRSSSTGNSSSVGLSGSSAVAHSSHVSSSNSGSAGMTESLHNV